jgi:hypothetical protein
MIARSLMLFALLPVAACFDGIDRAEAPAEADYEAELASGTVSFPAGAGVVDVKARYGAKGDGTTDDTAAIQRAIAENRGQVIFLPPGRYLVSDRLLMSDGRQATRHFLQGAGKARTTIKLKDRSPAFQDPTKPRAVVSYWESNDPAGPDTAKDANAFRATVQDLTIDVGKGNPGASGLRFRANNFGVVRDVVVRSTDANKRGVYGASSRTSSRRTPAT